MLVDTSYTLFYTISTISCSTIKLYKLQEVSEITRTGFASGKVNKVWPPPADELEKDAGQVNRVKCGDDFGWIQQVLSKQLETIK